MYGLEQCKARAKFVILLFFNALRSLHIKTHYKDIVTCKECRHKISSGLRSCNCVALYEQPGLERTVVIVETRVNDLSISTAGMHANFGFGPENDKLSASKCQRYADRQSNVANLV